MSAGQPFPNEKQVGSNRLLSTGKPHKGKTEGQNAQGQETRRHALPLWTPRTAGTRVFAIRTVLNTRRSRAWLSAHFKNGTKQGSFGV